MWPLVVLRAIRPDCTRNADEPRFGAGSHLYVDGATYNGADISGAAQTLLSEGAARFGFLDPLV